MQDGFSTISETSENLYCSKCAQNTGMFIELECDHLYCIMCASFLYSKCRKQYVNEAAMKCSVCGTVSILPTDNVELIKSTIRNQILPSMESQGRTTENKLTVSKNNQYTHFIGARKIKSQEHSFQNITPSTTKCFFSKCESPSSRKIQQKTNQRSVMNFCEYHAMEPISYLCLTCNVEPLCIKCISMGKQHSGHDVKQMNKAITILMEQLAENKLQISYKIDQAEMYQRRLDDRSTLIKNRSNRALTEIRQHFSDIYAKLQEKQHQIINQTRTHFTTALQKFQFETGIIREYIEALRSQKQQISFLRKQKNSPKFMKQMLDFQASAIPSLSNLDEGLENKLYVPSNTLFQSINDILYKVKTLTVNFKLTTLSRMGTVGVQPQNCRSQSKKKKQSGKRLKTNFVSLNSSRQKKKKTTKTEEDEKKIKHHHNGPLGSHRVHEKEGSSKKSNKMPGYITDFINKKGSKLGSQSASYLHEMTSNIPHSYTKVPKLSKTICPQQIIRKKKEHKAVIKQRLEIKKKHCK